MVVAVAIFVLCNKQNVEDAIVAVVVTTSFHYLFSQALIPIIKSNKLFRA